MSDETPPKNDAEHTQQEAQKQTYSQAGVNIAAGQEAATLMAEVVRSTYGPEVITGIGAFGGLFDISHLKTMDHPILVSSTDGVGTKTKVAERMGRWDTIGQDLVNHCINDILVQGATPLFFLDYVASSRLEPQQIASVVTGVATACRTASCALLGGETAEMPGVYEDGAVDLAGTIVGVVEKQRVIDGSRIKVGDILLNLPSTGLHTNGYSLARRVLASVDWEAPQEALGESVGDALLAIHRSYLPLMQRWWQADVDIRGLAHITGGGVIDNFPRILPEGLGAVVQPGTWTIPPIFGLIQSLGDIEDQEMYHVFNMGLGMIVVVSAEEVTAAQQALHEEDIEVTVVGEIVAGEGVSVAL